MNLKGFPAAGALPLGKMLRRTAGTGLLLGLILVGIARAHHGFDGRYNLATPVWVEGLVVEAYFGNPHSELTVEISSDLSMPAPLPDLGPAASFLDAQSLTVPEDLVGQTVVLELPPTAQYSSLGDRIARGTGLLRSLYGIATRHANSTSSGCSCRAVRWRAVPSQ